VRVIVCDEEEWAKWVSRLGKDFHDVLQPLQAPLENGSPAKDALSYLAQNGDAALVLVAPRGIGPTRWSEVGTPADNHVKRKFALIGQTLDGQRVWDVRRALAVLRGIADLKGQPTVLVGQKESAGLALYASLFEPDVKGLVLVDPPPSHVQGPILLNVRRYFDMPQAVALALPRQIEITVESKQDVQRWEWPRLLQQALGQKSLKIVTRSD
jgi:pimeloyl-ACP methyl ester carboxylesterase